MLMSFHSPLLLADGCVIRRYESSKVTFRFFGSTYIECRPDPRHPRLFCLGSRPARQDWQIPAEHDVVGVLMKRTISTTLSFMLIDEQPSREQIKALRERRLDLAEQLYWSARALKTAGVRYQHPDWSEEQISAEVT